MVWAISSMKRGTKKIKPYSEIFIRNGLVAFITRPMRYSFLRRYSRPPKPSSIIVAVSGSWVVIFAMVETDIGTGRPISTVSRYTKQTNVQSDGTTIETSEDTAIGVSSMIKLSLRTDCVLAGERKASPRTIIIINILFIVSLLNSLLLNFPDDYILGFR
jgi:hypothetical protein